MLFTKYEIILDFSSRLRFLNTNPSFVNSYLIPNSLTNISDFSTSWVAINVLTTSSEIKCSNLSSAIILPFSITITLSHSFSISSNKWDEIKIDTPVAAISLSLFLKSWTPCGSNPFTGSSRIRILGSLSNACANPKRWRIPNE